MAGNTSTTYWIPSSHSLLLHLIIEKNYQKHGKNSTIFLSSCIDIRLFWVVTSSGELFVFHRALVPSSVYVLPHLCISVGLQRLLLIPPQFTEVHSLYNQLSLPSHHLLKPAFVQYQLRNPKWDLK